MQSLRIGFLLLAVAINAGQAWGEEFQRVDRSAQGVVAAAHPLAAEAGLEMLRQGGNAIDAAAAAAFALTVVEPFASSIAGCGAALVYDAQSHEMTAYSYRSSAPLAATLAAYDNYSNRSGIPHSPRGPAIGGMVAGTCLLHADGGRLPLATVMAPAIRYAREGFPAGPTLVSVATDMYDVLANDPGLSATYLVDDFPPETGAILRNTDLAECLELIARDGPSAFYGGPIGIKIAEHMQSIGGLHAPEDYAAYKATRAEPLAVDFNGYRVYGAPPPYGGLTVLESVALIDRLPVDRTLPSRAPATLHLLAEVMKATAVDRNPIVGDPRFVKVPTDWILSDAFLSERVKAINVAKAVPAAEFQAGDVMGNPGDPGSTTHLSVIDGEGNAVSLTQTLGGFFGAGIMVPGTGIVLNDQMKNFSALRRSPNLLEPGKQMRSTQAPTLVTRDGELVLAIGSPGNYRIVTTVTQLLVDVLLFDMALDEAIDAPRIHARDGDAQLHLEGGFPPDTVEALRQRGHDVRVRSEYDLFFGGVHAVWRDPETKELIGAADRRRDGVALGLHLQEAQTKD